MTADDSTNNSVLSLLTARLSPKPRASVVRRYEAMVRELQYLNERRDEDLVFIRRHKWSEVRLRALFAVNSVYQEVLGPQQAAAKGSTAGLGRDLPILHGSQRFDGAQSASVNATLDSFFQMIADMGFQRDWMNKNTCGDLIFYIARHERRDLSPDQAG